MRKLLAFLLLSIAMPSAFAASCTLTVSDLSFGTYIYWHDTPLDQNAMLSVGCVSTGAASETVSYTLAIGPSSNGSFNPRSMTGSSGGGLGYNLYLDANRRAIWGDGAQGYSTVSRSLMLPGSPRADHIVYGRIPPNQALPSGTYVDVLTITISY